MVPSKCCCFSSSGIVSIYHNSNLGPPILRVGTARQNIKIYSILFILTAAEIEESLVSARVLNFDSPISKTRETKSIGSREHDMRS